jgi:hypothetical protein
MPEVGDFVELRGRRWLVESADAGDRSMAAFAKGCPISRWQAGHLRSGCSYTKEWPAFGI